MKRILAVAIVLTLLSLSVWAANLKITQLTEKTTPATTDLIPIVDSPGGTAVTKKVQIGNLPFAAKGAVTASGLTQATGCLLGRTSTSTGAVQEITAGYGQSLASTNLAVSLSTQSNTLASDVTLNDNTTWFSGPAVAVGAGTWIITASIQ